MGSAMFQPYRSIQGDTVLHHISVAYAFMYFDMVRKERLELSILSALASKTSVYTIPPLALKHF